MARRLHVDVRLATQVLLLQVAVVTLTLGIAGGLLAFMSHQRLAAQYEDRSLDMARAIAFAPAVRADVARYDVAPLTSSPALTDRLANGQLQTLATEIQQRTGVLFVVITNNQGIRLSHPNRDDLGKHVSTDPSEALAGHEVVTRQTRKLRTSVRAKVAVFAPQSSPDDGDVGLRRCVSEVLRAADPPPTLATVGDRIVVVSARHVARESRELGTVLIVRDRSDVESLTRQLDAVQLMSTVLRAQRHEFANRLHLLNGLLHSGHVDEAAQYVEELLGSGPLGSALPGIDTIRDAFLQAFLAAKAASAREAGVTLTIGENTWVPDRLALPVDVTTVLGNLIDNAIDAARTGEDETKVVEVELLQDGSTLHITVADSGDGVALDFVEHVFTEGKSTKPQSGIPGGRGIGMALSRQISRALGGDVRLSSTGNPDTELRGAKFIARLPGVMVEEEAQWAAQN